MAVSTADTHAASHDLRFEGFRMKTKTRVARPYNIVPELPRKAVVALRLPHERDERPEAGAPRRTVIRQAQRDIDAGQIDTDNYTRIAAVAARAPRPMGRRK